LDKEEIQITIAQTRKSLGEKDVQGNSKQTPCWTAIKLTDDYTPELLEAKAKAGSTMWMDSKDLMIKIRIKFSNYLTKFCQLHR